ncbi:MAG: four helix bundle protein [Calditrichaeota bacterium]|nr:four helix bundle protein [Calditrichota bacterium]
MAKRKIFNLFDLSAYRKSFDLSNLIWRLVISWPHFAKTTIGSQMVRAIDSVPARAC